jgi:hypothetical protein
VDATPANTARADGTAIGHSGPNSAEGAADGNWHLRSGVGNGTDNNVFASGGSGAENAPTLRTTISGLSDGTYDVFGYFWADPTNDWRIQIGLDEGNLMLVRDNGAQQAELAQFDPASGAMALSAGGASLYRVYVGRVDVLDGSTVDVFVNDQVLSSAAAGATRTWYDGVGYAPIIVPEPTTTGLVSLLPACVLLRRLRDSAQPR